jgi:5-formyltetrahydrofolate cyclo-ligase
MSINPAHERKVAIRQTVRAGRLGGFSCGDSHSKQLIDLIQRNGFKTIAAFEEFDNEPSLASLRDWCSSNNVVVLLPTIAENYDLTWHADGEERPLKTAELIVMPALAAGRDGNRLGRGKGYYDRAVSQLESPRVVVVHDSELYETLPAEEFDEKVSMVVTCSETISLDERLN